MSEYVKSYTPEDWESLELISHEKMNNIEGGISNAYLWLNDLDGNMPVDISDLNNDVGYITLLDVPQEIFIAVFGTTSFEDILAAYNAGKIVFCQKSGGYIIPLSKADSNEIHFYNFVMGTAHNYQVTSSDDWSDGVITYSSTSHTHSQYTTVSQVQDLIDQSLPPVADNTVYPVS